MKQIDIHLLEPATSDEQHFSRMRRYGGFWLFYATHKEKIVGLRKLQEWINNGEKIVVGNPQNKNKIICGLYCSDYWDGKIPYVEKSNHTRFVRGSRFDYGFMSVALDEGFTVYYNYAIKRYANQRHSARN